MGETPGRNERDRTKPDRLSACIRPADYESAYPTFATSGNGCESASELRFSSRSRWVISGRFPCTRGPNAAPDSPIQMGMKVRVGAAIRTIDPCVVLRGELPLVA